MSQNNTKQKYTNGKKEEEKKPRMVIKSLSTDKIYKLVYTYINAGFVEKLRYIMIFHYSKESC